MSNVEVVGNSGKSYSFSVFDYPLEWNEVAGVYIISRAEANSVGGTTFIILYVGETSNLKERMQSHHKQDCFKNNNASNLLWFSENQENIRLTIEQDVIDKWNPTCNH